jgi:hypothetical protein
MSDKPNIDTPHERRPFRDHGHMDVVTLGDFTLGPGDVIDLDPGHDAWTVGDEACVLIDTGVAAYALVERGSSGR